MLSSLPMWSGTLSNRSKKDWRISFPVTAGNLAIVLMMAVASVACTQTGPVEQPGGESATQTLQEITPTPYPSAQVSTRLPDPAPTLTPQAIQIVNPTPTPMAAITAPAPTPAAPLTLTDSPNGCPPVPDLGPDAYVIETVELNKVSPGITKSYLAACLEGAWRLMAQLSELGQLNQVGIAVVDSGIYQPNDTPTARKLALKHEFDWDRILVADMVQNRKAETEEEHIVRSHHGAAVTSTEPNQDWQG